MNSAPDDPTLNVLVLAPHGRDALLASTLLHEANLGAVIVADLPALVEGLRRGAGAVVATEEALANGDLSALHAFVTNQPPWADLPILLLTHRGGGVERNPAARRLSATLGNASFLERPFHPTTFVSLVEAALRSRRRQYDARDRLEDLRIAQEALRGANATLEQRVIERTTKLEQTEAALRQSQKLEAVGQLTGGIAHDFNNMLTGVIGSLDLMRRRIASERFDSLGKYVDVAAASAERAAVLTQRLLAFSRRQSLDAKPVEINGLVQAMDGLIAQAINEGISLHFGLGEDLPNAVVDAHQLESAILNLAINARDAMPSGGDLTIETSVIDLDGAYGDAHPGIAPGRYVVVAVSDTGVGMSQDLIEKAFDPFFTTKPLGQGTGLGLSMVYGFAQQSGGQVRIHSQPGLGTAVKIYLPSTEAPHPRKQGPVQTLADGAGRRVLVVEDDNAVRMLVREVLQELRYHSVEFADPLEALPFLASGEQIDLMISDVGLPGMNGRELAEKARAHRPDLPILFITGYAENAAIRAGFLGSNMTMLAKPFSLDTLAKRISQLIATS